MLITLKRRRPILTLKKPEKPVQMAYSYYKPSVKVRNGREIPVPAFVEMWEVGGDLKITVTSAETGLTGDALIARTKAIFLTRKREETPKVSAKRA